MAQICLFYNIIALFFIIKVSFNKFYFIIKILLSVLLPEFSLLLVQTLFINFFLMSLIKLFVKEFLNVLLLHFQIFLSFKIFSLFSLLIIFIIFQYKENTSYYLICYNILLYSYSINFF